MSKKNARVKGVSVIACTNKLGFMENIFSNFSKQKWPKKELIIILNNDSLNLTGWLNYARNYDNVLVYQLPEHKSLGACMNFGIKIAKYKYIAKFDDDDYYAPLYLSEAMNTFPLTNADIVGKRSYYMYMVNGKLLLIRFPSHEHCWSRLVHGGTIVAKKKVFQAVPFVNRRVGTDLQFMLACHNKGFSIYSTSRFNYTYFRREDKYHTWKADINHLLKTSEVVAVTSDYERYASPPDTGGQ